MRLFAIGDLHLPSSRNKDMERFGWAGHPAPLAAAWDALVKPEDLVLVVGDISWATKAQEATLDLVWIEQRPGKKVLLKGNHDYWWGDSANKLRQLLLPTPSIVGFLHNGSALVVGPYLLAGSRLWTTAQAPPLPGGEMGDEPPSTDYVQREATRLQRSLAEARALLHRSPGLTKVVLTHFPPLYAGGLPTAFSPLIEDFAPQVCVYGHLHGPGISAGFVGVHGGVRYVLASADAAGFKPLLLLPDAASLKDG
ncbi:MAG: metallophosphoesterase [Myxococcaceae bacterium]